MQNTNLYKLPAIENWLRSDLAMYFILALIMLLAYGYEIFNFHLSIDDENNIYYQPIDAFRLWISQGRWAMAVLRYAVVPYPIVPTISIALGVSGIAIGILTILRSIFQMDKTGLLLITALAATIPTFPFILVFNANAYGTGFGFIAIAIASLLIHNRNINSLLLACILAGFAIGIYQTFVFILAIVVIAQMWQFSIKAENIIAFVRHIVYPILFFFGSIITYLLIQRTFKLLFPIYDDKYINYVISASVFINNSLKKLIFAYYEIINVINLEPKFFGIQSIWLNITLLLSLIIILVNLLIQRSRFVIGIITISILIAWILIFSIALFPGNILLRSVIHIPFGIAIIVAYAYILSGEYIKRLLIVIYGLTIIGNSAINNHLFASSALAEFRDRMLAQDIINEVKRLKPENAQDATYKLVLIGNHSWPVTAIQSRSHTIGTSFFGEEDGNVLRIAACLRLNGLNTVAFNGVEIYNKIKNMPVWPKSGWVSIMDDILILKFTDYSDKQKQQLCASGITELCLTIASSITPSINIPQGYTESNSINCDGSIDHLNGIDGVNKITNSSLILINNDFRVNGWLAVTGKDGIVPDDMFIKLTNETGSSLYAKAHKTSRQDVNKYFKQSDTLNFGFQRIINVNSLKGKYTLSLVRGYKGKLEPCTRFNVPININKK